MITNDLPGKTLSGIRQTLFRRTAATDSPWPTATSTCRRDQKGVLVLCPLFVKLDYRSWDLGCFFFFFFFFFFRFCNYFFSMSSLVFFRFSIAESVSWHFMSPQEIVGLPLLFCEGHHKMERLAHGCQLLQGPMPSGVFFVILWTLHGMVLGLGWSTIEVIEECPWWVRWER